MRAKVTVTLIGINLAALLFAAWAVESALSESPFPKAKQSAPDTTSSNPAISSQFSNDALLSSPLFTPSRQPQSELEPESMQIAPPAPPRLAGIVKEGSKARLVLLEAATGKSRGLINVGQVFEGWVVAEIRQNAVTLTPSIPQSTSNAGGELSLYLHPNPAGNDLRQPSDNQSSFPHSSH